MNPTSRVSSMKQNQHAISSAMTTLADIKQALHDEMPYLRERYHVDQIGICGSFVRGDQTPESDVDLLVTFTETPDLLTFVNLKRYLERSLNRDVDLGMLSALKDSPATDNKYRTRGAVF